MAAYKTDNPGLSETGCLPLTENLLDFYRYVARKTGIPSGEENFFWISNRQGKWPKWVFGQDFEPDFFEEQVAATIRRMKARELPPYWNVIPGVNQERLCRILEADRFRQVYRWTGMSLDMNDYLNVLRSVADFECREVESMADCEDFVQVVNATLLQASNMEFALAEKLLGDENFRMVIGRYRGIAVSTAALYLSGDTAGIYFVATRKEYRRSGLGTAITGKCLELAQLRKVKTVILHASAMGEPVYRSMGFKEVRDGSFMIYWLVGRAYR